MSLKTSVHEIKTLALSYHPIIAIETVEETRVSRVVSAVSDQLSQKLFEWSVTDGLIAAGKRRAVLKTEEPTGLLLHVRELSDRAIYLLKDFTGHLDNPATTRLFREVTQQFAKMGSTFILTGDPVELPNDIQHQAVYYELQLPERDELHRAVRSVIQSIGRTSPTSIDVNTDEYESFLRALRGLTLNQARQAVAYALIEDGKLASDDIAGVLERKVGLIREGGILEYYPAEDNQYELGGFATLKDWLDRARVGFGEEAKKYNLRAPKGLLIVGVQGCGKSLAAKFIARQWRLPLLKLDAGRLFDKFIGESEKNFRKACAVAESMAPAVLWIDEIEKGISTGGSGGGGGSADGGLSRRLFGAFLTWLQEKKEEVFVVATANDLSILPPELLRKGRFDEIFFVDLPNEEERRRIFEIHLKLKNQELRSYDLDQLVEAAAGFSGAEIEQAVVASLYRAIHRGSKPSTKSVLEELAGTVPLSVSRREDIVRLRETAKDRFVNVR